MDRRNKKQRQHKKEDNKEKDTKIHDNKDKCEKKIIEPKKEEDGKEKEEEVPDFSHLKKETEKIKELSKKSESPNIVSNWKKYEPVIITEPKEDITPELSDFELLVHTPRSEGAHFQFKSEKNWGKSESNKWGTSDLFNLDLNLILSGLACIPFYERIGIDKSRLNDEDVEKCDYFASRSQERYKSIQETFKTKLNATKSQPTSSSKESSPMKEMSDVSKTEPHVEIKKATNPTPELEVKQSITEVRTENMCSNSETVNMSIPIKTVDADESNDPNKSEANVDSSPKGQRVRKKGGRTNVQTKVESKPVVEDVEAETLPQSFVEQTPVIKETALIKVTKSESDNIQTSVTAVNNILHSDEENLEDWLDSVLDD